MTTGRGGGGWLIGKTTVVLSGGWPSVAKKLLKYDLQIIVK